MLEMLYRTGSRDLVLMTEVLDIGKTEIFRLLRRDNYHFYARPTSHVQINVLVKVSKLH